MKEIIADIIRKKKHVYFISPSFGDMACYAGDLFGELTGKVDITVINVFTSPGDGRMTFSAKQYVRSLKSSSAKRLYEVLDASDTVALQPFHCDRVNLGMIDALFRREKKPNGLRKILSKFFVEAISLYPFFAIHVVSGKLSKEDSATEKNITNKLRKIIKDTKKSVVFCPLGYGKHVDYLLMRNACSKAFGEDVIYYSDISDTSQFAERETFVREHLLKPVVFVSEQTETKKTLLCSYKHLAGEKEMYLHPEIYYLHQEKHDDDSNYAVKIYTKDLPQTFLDEWKMLWETSLHRHYFNAPAWTLASSKAFTKDNFNVIAIYKKNLLVAVLPLVREKKYGISIYKTPGGQYFDRSPLLVKNDDSILLQVLVRAAKQLGNFYLSEIDESLLRSLVPYVNQLGVFETSKSPFLVLEPDPHRFLSWKNKKGILKTMQEEKDNFVLKIFTDDTYQHVQTIRAIEKKSTKKKNFKETLSDTRLDTFYKALDTFAPGTLWFAILSYKDNPICYNYGFVVDNVFGSTGTSFDVRYRQFAPGLVLTYLLLPQLKEKGITVFDFSRGVSRYKRDFALYSYTQYAIVYSPYVFVRFWIAGCETLRVWLERHLKKYLDAEGFEIEMDMITKMKKLGYLMYSVPITYDERAGETKIQALSDGIRVLRTFFKNLNWSPKKKKRNVPTFGLERIYSIFNSN